MNSRLAFIYTLTFILLAGFTNAYKITTECKISQYFDEDAEKCINYFGPAEKASTDFGKLIDSGNTAWMLVSCGLVFLMTPGVGFFYAGLAGRKFASNTIMMSYISAATIAIQFFVFGYTLAFNQNMFGSLFYDGVGATPSGVYGIAIPHAVWALFQTQFAAVAPALISGSIVGRMKFGSYIVFILLWTFFVYDPLARWMWSGKLNNDYTFEAMGWEAKLGSLDFAGGTVIHVSSGFSALVAALIVGKRTDYGIQNDTSVKPHSIPLVMLGTTLLWFGWFGFNAGSAAAADGVAAIAAVNTHLSAGAGFLTWLLVQFLATKFFGEKKAVLDLCGAASGAIAGLVSITPGCGYVAPWVSPIFGICGASIAYIAITIMDKLHCDDTLYCFAIHGCAGFAGGILTGFFASPEVNGNAGVSYDLWVQVKNQFIANGFTAVYSATCTAVLLLGLKLLFGLRVAEDKENDGMDVSYHGGAAYTFVTDTN